MADAAEHLKHERAEADARSAAEEQVAALWEEMQAAAKEAASSKAAEEVKAKAAFILTDLQPPVAPAEAIDGVRQELVAAAQAEADAAYEAAKAEASEKARADAEAKVRVGLVAVVVLCGVWPVRPVASGFRATTAVCRVGCNVHLTCHGSGPRAGPLPHLSHSLIFPTAACRAAGAAGGAQGPEGGGGGGGR